MSLPVSCICYLQHGRGPRDGLVVDDHPPTESVLQSVLLLSQGAGERLVSLDGREGRQPVDLQPAGDVGGRLIDEGELLSPDGEGDGEVPVRLRPDLLGLDVIGRGVVAVIAPPS